MKAKRPRQPPKPKQSLVTQSGTYAGEKLSDSYSISHALNLLIKGATQNAHIRFSDLCSLPDHYIWISWIDREGVIVSSRFSPFEHLPLVLDLLLTLQRSRPR